MNIKFWKQEARAAIARLKNNRLYALTEDGLTAIGSAFCAHMEKRGLSHVLPKDGDEFVDRLVAAGVPLVQQRDACEEKLPEIPKDIFGRPLPNPWESGGRCPIAKPFLNSRNRWRRSASKQQREKNVLLI
jgi:hypothetical protein